MKPFFTFQATFTFAGIASTGEWTPADRWIELDMWSTTSSCAQILQALSTEEGDTPEHFDNYL